MDVNKILKADYLDILFDNRNKTYGGYELRKKYPKRITVSMLVLVIIMAASVAYGVISNIKPKVVVEPVVTQQEVKLAEPPPVDPKMPPPPPPPSAPPAPLKPTVAFTPPVIKKDEEVKEDEKPPEQTKLENNAISTVTNEKGDPNGIDPGLVETPGGTGTGLVEAAAPPPAILEYVEQMPEFPNIMKYLSEHINYPESAKENGVEGKVIVRFVVNEDGGITDAKVVRGVNSALDQEALRVIRSMPKWKPGKQNGHAVKVYFTQPITFRLE